MATEPSPRRFYRFGAFELDALSGELYRHGEPVRLPPKPAKLLLRLVTARGQLVTKEELERTLWGDDTFVDFEQGIRKAITQIRAALDYGTEQKSYIETVSKRGYRFVAEALLTEPQSVSQEQERTPYPGLAPFSEADAEFFFGREEEAARIWERIQSKHFVALVGPSGTGKSSFLRARLLPSRPKGFEVAMGTPGSSPLSLIERLLGSRSGAVLLVVDAFEELFTRNPPEVQREFAARLGDLACGEDIHVLLSMRDDFLFRCHEHDGLRPVFSELYPFGPMTEVELRQALVGPASACGYRFEDDRIVDEMLAEVAGNPGALPLLAFAASRLWERRDRAQKLLTRAAFEEGGRVAGALAQHAEATLQSIAAEHRSIVREIFRNLSTSHGTRFAVDRDELLSGFEDRAAAESVLDRLVNARLLTSSEGEIAIIHESLLFAWPTLMRWQAQDAEGAILRDQLRQASHLWTERRRSAELLWAGSPFKEFALWRERYPGGLTSSEEAFVRAMTARAQRRNRWAVAVWVTAALVASTLLGLLLLRGASSDLAVREFSISPPENSKFAPGQAPVLSSDGTRVAFAATDSSGKTLLWVRALESLTAHPIPGTESGALPFWSPDSRSLGFFADGVLKTVDLEGGAPQILCDASPATGGSWSAEGVIVFGIGTSGPLYKVSASGGAPSRFTSPTTEVNSHRWPQFLPDGRHFLYFGMSGRKETRGIYLGSLDAPNGRLLVSTESGGTYAPIGKGNGYLFLVRDGSLIARPLDVVHQTLIGEGFAVAARVAENRLQRQPLFSTSTRGSLVYRTAGDTTAQRLTWFDRSGKELGTLGPPGSYRDLSLSPDGGRVSLSRLDPIPDVWVLDIARGTSSRLTFDPSQDIFPQWSPDGRRIAFSSSRDGPYNLYLKSSTGVGAEEPVFQSNANKYLHDWSSDGSYLVYQTTSSRGDNDIWLLSLHDTKAIPLLTTESEERQPAISPDVRWMAYVSNESGRHEVYVQEFPRTGGKWQVSTAGGYRPSWRQDGKELFYIDTDGKLMAVPVKTNANVFEKGTPETLFQTPMDVATAFVGRQYGVVADGQRVLMVAPPAGSDFVPFTVVLDWRRIRIGN